MNNELRTHDLVVLQDATIAQLRATLAAENKPGAFQLIGIEHLLVILCGKILGPMLVSIGARIGYDMIKDWSDGKKLDTTRTYTIHVARPAAKLDEPTKAKLYTDIIKDLGEDGVTEEQARKVLDVIFAQVCKV